MFAKLSAILLAAGLSRRMGDCDKLIFSYENRTLLDRAISLMDSLPFYEKILVTTANRLKNLYLPDSVRLVLNTGPEDGQSSSLRLGVEKASGEYYLFMAADQPLLDKDVLLKLIHAAEENPGRIIYPTAKGKPSNPALFPASFRKELLSQTGDAGGRKIIREYPECCYAVEIENSMKLFDIDCQKDLEVLRQLGES